MRAQDIETSAEYLAGPHGVGRYSARAKCRVVGPGKADGNRMRRSGARFWEVEWLAPYRTTDRVAALIGTTTSIPSAWIDGPWTAEHEAAHEAESGLAAANNATLRALAMAFGLDVPTGAFYDSAAPVITMRGGLTEGPTFTLTDAAAKKILAAVAPSRSDQIRKALVDGMKDQI